MTPSATVVGAGPAGLSAAIGLARAGYRTHVVEKRLRWAGRVCGCFLSPEAVRHLEWLHTLPEVRAAAVEVTETVVTWQDKILRLPIGAPGSAGLALPRQQLEEILTRRAQNDGVTIERGGSSEGTSDVRVLASGRFATVDKSETPAARAWYGWNATFSDVAQRPGQMSMHFFPNGYVGVVTFANGLSNVCGLSLNPDHRNGWSVVFNGARVASPAFARVIASAALEGEWRGVGPLPFFSSMRTATDAVLAGDAAAVGDPFMGEGNSRALAAGPMLFEAIHAAGSNWQTAYRRAWARAYRSRLRAGAALRWVLERSILAHRVLPLMLEHPALIRRLSPVFHRGYFL
jgi:flavin-dependent dehydrogenase